MREMYFKEMGINMNKWIDSNKDTEPLYNPWSWSVA